VVVADVSHVLAATDLLDTSRYVIPRAGRVARHLSTCLGVVHVLSGNGQKGEREGSEDRIAKTLKRETDGLADVDLRPEVRVLHGVPGAAIEAEGSRSEAGLYVLGFHREAPSSPKRLGSTMTHLLVHTKADVLLVKSKDQGSYRSVVIAWDGEKDLKPAMDRVAEYAPEADVAIFFNVTLARDLADGEDRLRRVLVEAGFSPADISPHVSADGLLSGLRDVLREENADLLVLPPRGSQGGDLGFMASEILSQRLCDTLCFTARP